MEKTEPKKASFQSWRGNNKKQQSRPSSKGRPEAFSPPPRVEQRVPIAWAMFKRDAFLGQGAYGDVYKVECLQSTCLSQDGTCRVKISDQEAANIKEIEQTKNQQDDGSKGPFLNKNRILIKGEFYVIKTINVANLDQKAQFEALNEIETLQIMRSQNIVGYLDSFVGGDDNEPLINIVIEFCQVGDLHSYIIQYLEENEKLNRGGQYLAESTVWKLFIDLCLGLEHMHRVNYIHRDLKPLNVFITEDGVAKLGDLGCALKLSEQDEEQQIKEDKEIGKEKKIGAMGSSTQSCEVSMNDSMVMQNLMSTMQKHQENNLDKFDQRFVQHSNQVHNNNGDDDEENPVGTPYYVSPEIWTKRQYSRASDIWALGVILYEMLSLKKPFPANDQAELVEKVCNQPYLRIRFGVSKTFKSLVDQMLQKDPKKRPNINDITTNTEFQNMAAQYKKTMPKHLGASGGPALESTIETAQPTPTDEFDDDQQLEEIVNKVENKQQSKPQLEFQPPPIDHVDQKLKQTSSTAEPVPKPVAYKDINESRLFHLDADAINLDESNIHDAGELPQEEIVDQRFFTREQDDAAALKDALDNQLLFTSGQEGSEPRDEQADDNPNLQRRESLLLQYLSNSMYDSVDASMMRKNSQSNMQNFMIGEQSFLHDASMALDSQVDMSELREEANLQKDIMGSDEVTLYLEPLPNQNQIPLDQHQKVEIHGTFSVKRPWLDKIPCVWDSALNCFKVSLNINEADKFRFIINDGQRFECSKLYETYKNSIGNVNNIYSAKHAQHPTAQFIPILQKLDNQEPALAKQQQQQSREQPREQKQAQPTKAAAQQFQIIEIVKNGKVVQVKVPIKDESAAANKKHRKSKPANEKSDPAGAQEQTGMTNLQRKKLANKNKLATDKKEIDKKQSRYLEKLYQYSEKLVELKEKKKLKKDTEDDREQMARLEMKSKKAYQDFKSLRNMPMKLQLEKMNFSTLQKQFSTILEVDEGNTHRSGAVPTIKSEHSQEQNNSESNADAGAHFELNESAAEELLQATSGKDSQQDEQTEEQAYFTARDEQQIDEKDDSKEPRDSIAAAEKLDKYAIKSKVCTLENLVEMLEQAYQALPDEGFEDLIIALGNTGCGKSTMFTSLVFGPESLQLKTIEESVSIRLRDGSMKEKKVKYQVIDQTEDLNAFTIGHSKSESMTFLPHFVKDHEAGVVYADIAGLQDTSGDLVEFINCFVTRKIFQMGKNVRFIVPFTETQIKENKGQQARALVQMVQQTCGQNSLTQVIGSIQPVLTKCKPGAVGLDIDEVRSVFAEQLMNDLGQGQSDDQVTDELMQDQEQFFNQFAFSLEIFDPLDRCIPSEDDDQTQKCYNMKDILVQLPSLQGSTLNQPMSNSLRTILHQLFQKELQKCNRIAELCVNEAKEMGGSAEADLAKKFQEDEHIKAYHRILKFFLENELLDDAQQSSEQFRLFIKSTLKMIGTASTFRQMSQQGQQMYDYIQSMFIARNQQNYVGLVKCMINLQNMIDEFKVRSQQDYQIDQIEEKAELILQINNAQRAVEDTVVHVANSFQELVQFAHELRKQDVEDRYTYGFINGQVKPPILVDIICSNQWNGSKQRMEVDMTMACFRLMVGRASCLQYQSQDANRPVSDKEAAIVVTKATPMHKNHVDSVAFILESRGVLIETLDGRQLAASDIMNFDANTEQGSSKNLRWASRLPPRDSGIVEDQDQMVGRLWRLNTLDSDSWDPHFHIELTTGEKKQRLVSRVGNPTLYSKCIATSKDSDGYDVSEQSVWKVYLKPVQKFLKRR